MAWGHQRLPAPPTSYRPRWGVVRFEGLRAAMPWPHIMPCGRAVAPFVAPLPPSGCARNARSSCADCRQTTRVVATWLPRPASAQGKCLPLLKSAVRRIPAPAMKYNRASKTLRVSFFCLYA